MSKNRNPIKTMILEDIDTLAMTIKGVFEAGNGIEVAPGEIRKHECRTYKCLKAILNPEAQDYIKKCELAIIDLDLPEERLAGARAVLDSRFSSPKMRKVIYTGMPGMELNDQQWIDVCVKMMWLGAWDFVMKKSREWKGEKIDSVQYLYNRIKEKWENEENDYWQMELARTNSLDIRKTMKNKWGGKYVGFWADRDGAVHPTKEEMSDASNLMIGDTYLEVVTKYIDIRNAIPDNTNMPEHPFVTYMDTQQKEQ
jgi:hypothetical protein